MNSKKLKKVLSTSIASLTVLSTLNGSISTKIYASLDGDVPQKTEATSQAEELLSNGYYNNTEIKILSVQYGKCVFNMYYGNLNDNEREQFLELFTNENTINTLKSVEIPEEKNLKEVNVNLTNIFPSIINTSEYSDITKEEIAKRLLDECFDNAIKSISSSSENSDERLTSTAAETENKLTMKEQLGHQLDSMDAQLDQILLKLHSMMNGPPTEQNDSIKPKEETIEETKVISEGNSSLEALEKQADQMASQLSSILSKFSTENDSLKNIEKEPLKTIETDITKTKDELTEEIKAVSENNPTVESPESSKPDSKTEEEPKEQNPTQTPVISENESKSNSKSGETKTVPENNPTVETPEISKPDSKTKKESKEQNPTQTRAISEEKSKSNSKSEEVKTVPKDNSPVETPETSKSDSKTKKESDTTNNDDNDLCEALISMFGENSADSKTVPSAKEPEISKSDSKSEETKSISEDNSLVESSKTSESDSDTKEKPKKQNPAQTRAISEEKSESNSKSEEDKSISEDNSPVKSSKTSKSDSDTEEEPKKQNPAQAPVISENESKSNSKSEEDKSISEDNSPVETPETSKSDSKTKKESNKTNDDDNDPFEILRKMFGENSADSKTVPSAKEPETSKPSFENKQAEEANQTVKEDKPASTGLNTSANAAPALNLPKNNKSKKPGFFSRIWLNIKKFLRMLPLIGRIFG